MSYLTALTSDRARGGPGMQIATNTKYVSPNPIAKALVRRFFASVRDACRAARDACAVLDVGSGEGVVLREALLEVVRPRCLVAVDISLRDLGCCAANVPLARLAIASGYNLPFPARSFDLVMCCEVLEHVPDPRDFLSELARVASKWLVLSVPHEPLWRALNCARGRYVSDLGNTPGHLNHWSRAGFTALVQAVGLRVVRVFAPLPWTVVVARTR